MTLRPASALGPGTHARYALVVERGGSINRDAWARLVAELLQRETKGKKLPFARLIGVDARTVDRWLRREVDVKEESVREVARKFKLHAIDLLVQVGFYQAADIAPPKPADPREDPVIRQILDDPRWTDEERTELVRTQLARIEADLQRRHDEYERLVRLRPSQRDAS